MTTGNSIYHYATCNDYKQVIIEVKSQLHLKYAIDEWRLDANYRTYCSPVDAPEFGDSKWGRASSLMMLILMENARLPFAFNPRRQVAEKYGPDQSLLGNPPNYWWINFHPSGFHRSEELGEGLIQGWLSTNSIHPDSKVIFKVFKSAIKKKFVYIRSSGVYVGSEAALYAERGGRLTHDLRRSLDADVKLIHVTSPILTKE